MENNVSEDSRQQYSFALKRIQLLEKNLEIVAIRESDDRYAFEISSKVNIDHLKHFCINMFGVKVKLKTDPKVLASISIVCVFEIFNFDDVIVDNPHTPSLPQGLLNLLNTVVIGTMRGVMFSEFRGTALDNVVLPVLDPSKFERS